jgi:hypothetical protein
MAYDPPSVALPKNGHFLFAQRRLFIVSLDQSILRLVAPKLSLKSYQLQDLRVGHQQSMAEAPTTPVIYASSRAHLLFFMRCPSSQIHSSRSDILTAGAASRRFV